MMRRHWRRLHRGTASANGGGRDQKGGPPRKDRGLRRTQVLLVHAMLSWPSVVMITLCPVALLVVMIGIPFQSWGGATTEWRRSKDVHLGHDSVNGGDVVRSAEKNDAPFDMKPGGQDDEEEIADSTGTLCFVSAIFAETKDIADKIGNVEAHARSNPTFHFFLFTNLKDLDAPGWVKIVQTDLPYQRLITQSRWGKFLGWKSTELQPCSVVFYADGHLIPLLDDSAATKRFHDIAKQVKKSKCGLAQKLHATQSYHRLAWSIRRYKKDTPEHVAETMKFLQSQPDFHKRNTTIYLNQFFAFDPRNEKYRSVSSFFWDIYAKEQGSWRDQLLWCYVLDKFQMVPIELPDRALLYRLDKSRQGFNGHKYVVKEQM